MKLERTVFIPACQWWHRWKTAWRSANRHMAAPVSRTHMQTQATLVNLVMLRYSAHNPSHRSNLRAASIKHALLCYSKEAKKTMCQLGGRNWSLKLQLSSCLYSGTSHQGIECFWWKLNPSQSAHSQSLYWL
jgi:hypothetical protein